MKFMQGLCADTRLPMLLLRFCLLLSLSMQLLICLWARLPAAQAKGCAISHAREMQCCFTVSSLTLL